MDQEPLGERQSINSLRGVNEGLFYVDVIIQRFRGGIDEDWTGRGDMERCRIRLKRNISLQGSTGDNMYLEG